jgi:MoaA/NifB/PqqE/SkfB family radical SAM enzyme
MFNGNFEKEALHWARKERLSIEVTTECNNACSHCFARLGTAENTSLPIDIVKQIIQEAYDTGYRRLHLTGGEPLLWEGLFEILDYAFEMGYKTTFLNSNGTLLTEDVANNLAAFESLSISVSLEGSKALHDRLRGEGSFRHAVQGIEAALNAGVGIYVFAMATKSLLADLPQFADEIYRKFPTIKRLTLIPLINVQDSGGSLSQELLSPEGFLEMVRTVALLNVGGFITDVINEPLVNVASKLLEILWIHQALSLCRQGSMIVLANRSICLSHSTRNSFGEYNPGMIQKVLASDVYRQAVAPDEKTCPTCKYVNLCKENGMIRPSEGYGDMANNGLYCKTVLDLVGS